MYIKDGYDEQYILVYVDDIIIVGSSDTAIQSTARQIGQEFEVRIEERVKKFLGIVIERGKTGEMRLHSAPTIARMVEKFNCANARPISTPMPAGTILSM